MDLVIRVPRHPRIGETVLGTSFGSFLGGKGFNQAVAAARLGAAVDLIGAVGTDDYGNRFAEALAAEGIAGSYLRRDPEGTGVAVPVVDDRGRNSIVMVPRANMCLAPDDVRRAAGAIAAARVLLLQLEVPAIASLEAAAIARRAGGIVAWNLAPYMPLPEGALEVADLVIVNEAEAGGLLGDPPGDEASALRAAHAIRLAGPRMAAVTMGEHGVAYAGESGAGWVPAHPVPAIDTVGAGDAFAGALAWALASGEPLDVAVRYGNAAGALSTLAQGAAPSMPRREEVESLLEGS